MARLCLQWQYCDHVNLVLYCANISFAWSFWCWGLPGQARNQPVSEMGDECIASTPTQADRKRGEGGGHVAVTQFGSVGSPSECISLGAIYYFSLDLQRLDDRAANVHFTRGARRTYKLKLASDGRCQRRGHPTMCMSQRHYLSIQPLIPSSIDRCLHRNNDRNKLRPMHASINAC